ncbi:MAG TPA: nuclear transport factor 2 family protein [Solirubrobacteraceae bacterium]
MEIVSDALGRFVTTGEPPWDVIADDVEVHDYDMMDASDYRGHGGFGRWIEDWSAAWSEESTEPQEFLDAGERVVVFIRQRTTGHGSGVTLEREDAMVFGIRDRKIVRLDYYNNRAAALKAVGLEE